MFCGTLFSLRPRIGAAVVVLVLVSVLFSGCSSPTDQRFFSVTAAPGVTSGPGSGENGGGTAAPSGTGVSASLPYGVTLTVPADWTRQDVMTGGARDYGTTTLTIANFSSPPPIPNDRSSSITLSVDIDPDPGTDFESYFNNATIAVQKTYTAHTRVEVRSYTLKISGYKSYELDLLTEQVKCMYLFTSTKNGMYIFAFRVPNKQRSVQAFNSAVVDIYQSIRINPPSR